MDEKFQDKIDNYLLNLMDDSEKTEFLREVERDKNKKEQLEFTQNVKYSIRSREEKLKAIKQFQRQYEQDRRTVAYGVAGIERATCHCPAPEVAATEPVWSKKMWPWISAVTAVLLVCFFTIKPLFDYESSPHYSGAPMEQMRGGDDVFSPNPADSMDNDTIKYNIEKIVNPDE